MPESRSFRPLIVLFAKAPVPGRVKTRLQPALSADQAAALHSAMVRDALEMLTGLHDVADVEIHTDSPTDEWADFSFPRRQQPGGDLGQRLLSTMAASLADGRPSVVILGSDSPGLPAGHLHNILLPSADVALGPTEDGGFYAISCRATTPRMFEGVRWSTSNACSDTIASIQRGGLSVEIGSLWFDIDEPQDLSRLLKLKTIGRQTAAWLSELSMSLSAGDLLPKNADGAFSPRIPS